MAVAHLSFQMEMSPLLTRIMTRFHQTPRDDGTQLPETGSNLEELVVDEVDRPGSRAYTRSEAAWNS